MRLNNRIAFSVERLAYRKNKKLLLSAIRYPLSAKKGFTLVEVVVALLILLITAAGVMSSFTAVRHYVARTKRRAVTTNFARQELEKAVAGVRQDTWTNPTNPLYVPPGSSRTYSGSVSNDFSATWQGVSSYTVVNDMGTAFRRITANVEWDEPDAQ